MALLGSLPEDKSEVGSPPPLLRLVRLTPASRLVSQPGSIIPHRSSPSGLMPTFKCLNVGKGDGGL